MRWRPHSAWGKVRVGAPVRIASGRVMRDRAGEPVYPPHPPAVRLAPDYPETAERTMSKGLDQKKQDKKKPEKTLKEKRAEKKEKKGK